MNTATTTQKSLTEEEENLLKPVFLLQMKIQSIIDKINWNEELLNTIRGIIQTFSSTGTLVEWTGFRTAITMSLNKNGVR